MVFFEIKPVLQNKLEEIILIKVPSQIYPDIRKIFIFYFVCTLFYRLDYLVLMMIIKK